MTDACVFLLAGGRSSRMGNDKAFLRFGENTLIERALATARAAVSCVRIVGSREKYEGLADIVEDQFPGCGPLAGIHAALRSSLVDYNLMLAVDMPFLGPDLLVYLLDKARRSQAVVTLPRSAAVWQPLCAVYRRAFAGPAESALLAGRYRIDALFADLPIRVIEAEELSEQGFSSEIFRNLNTPEEFEQATLARKE
jgi:molybdenum cofactor guanylyltransferase